jgi:ATP-binding cassette subfamily A (ABC1) protein 5
LFQTAGILGNFAVNIMSLLYFIQVFVDDSSSVAFWLVSLISSTGFALAMDKVKRAIPYLPLTIL